MQIKVATVMNMIKIFTKNPKILHIICHGDYDKNENEFYLAFENEKAELDKVITSRLKEVFGKKNTSLKLVFINACHSE